MRRRALPALALALLTSSALAQEAPAPARLTLTEAVRRGGADPPAVRLALARAEVARLQIASAEAAYYPSVTVGGSASVSYNAFSRRTTGLIIGGRALEQETSGDTSGYNLNASADARVPIWDFGRTANGVSAAERSAGAARSDLRAARVTAMGAVASAYLTVLSDEEAIAAARVTVTQREAHLRIAEGLVSTGARPPIERTRAEVNLDVARLDLTRAEARTLTDRAALAAALGVDPVRSIEVAQPDDALLRADDEPARAAETAVAARPELAAARQRVAQAESQLAAARSGRNPVLAASAGASVSYNGVLGGVGTTGNNESVQAGVNLSWPVFDPAVRANIRVAEGNASTARATLAQQSIQVRAAAVQAAIAVRTARVALDQAERLAVNAAANLEQATGRYQAGAAPLLELVDAQAADASARAQVVTARFAWQVARVNLLTATGEIERLAR